MSPSSSPPPASAVPPPHVVEDCLGIVQLLSDGTVTRGRLSASRRLPDPPAVVFPDDLSVEWKDVVYSDTHGVRLRMYRPTVAGGGGGEKKLPVVVYFHGGGFCIASFELPNFHAVGLRLANDLPAVVLSADYRLAPEHRLPAAYDDAEAVLSLLSGAGAGDEWLAASADFERVFVCGDSAGGNISHHLAVRYGSLAAALKPVRVAGCVLMWPYFGGEERTASEAEAAPADAVMGLSLFDQMWRLALPEGVTTTRDHPAANPFGTESAPLDAVAFPPVLVAGPDQDLLRDRTADYFARLQAMGKPVELVTFQGQGHAFFVHQPWGAAADELLRVLRRFVHGAGAAA